MSTDEKKEPQLVDEIIKDITQTTHGAVRPPVQQVTKKAQKLPQSPIIKPKFYYDVKVESMIPATLTFRVLAEDAQQAAELIRGQNPISIKHRLMGRKDIKMSVYDAGSTMLRWMKNLIG
jgi:hypothetical protein